jgi:hypothetical protein
MLLCALRMIRGEKNVARRRERFAAAGHAVVTAFAVTMGSLSTDDASAISYCKYCNINNL